MKMTREKKLESMLIIAAGFIVLFIIFKIKWFLLIAFAVAFLGALSESFTNAITWLWFKLAEILGWVNSRVLLGLIFYTFLFPLAMIMKLTNKINLNLKRGKASYFSERNHLYKAGDIENPW